MSRFVVVVFSLLLSLASHASGNILTERYNLTYLDLGNGLPHNNVRDIFQDSNGFLWIATYGGGLVRYDGYGVKELRLELNSKSCRSITEDRFKRLWVAFDEGTNVINLNTMLPIVPKTASGDISELLSQPGVKTYCDALGRIWLITTRHVNLISFADDGRISQIATYKYTAIEPLITDTELIHIDYGL